MNSRISQLLRWICWDILFYLPHVEVVVECPLDSAIWIAVALIYFHQSEIHCAMGKLRLLFPRFSPVSTLHVKQHILPTAGSPLSGIPMKSNYSGSPVLSPINWFQLINNIVEKLNDYVLFFDEVNTLNLEDSHSNQEDLGDQKCRNPLLRLLGMLLYPLEVWEAMLTDDARCNLLAGLTKFFHNKPQAEVNKGRPKAATTPVGPSFHRFIHHDRIVSPYNSRLQPDQLTTFQSAISMAKQNENLEPIARTAHGKDDASLLVSHVTKTQDTAYTKRKNEERWETIQVHTRRAYHLNSETTNNFNCPSRFVELRSYQTNTSSNFRAKETAPNVGVTVHQRQESSPRAPNRYPDVDAAQGPYFSIDTNNSNNARMDSNENQSNAHQRADIVVIKIFQSFVENDRKEVRSRAESALNQLRLQAQTERREATLQKMNTLARVSPLLQDPSSSPISLSKSSKSPNT